MKTIGVIGGNGLDNADVMEDAHEDQILKDERDVFLDTPWGQPSSPLRRVNIAGREVLLLARHGREHTIPPSQVNYRANIQALKQAGCEAILATTACGSLREEIGRGDLVILDQFIDFTRKRANTFHERFEPHNPVHTSLADPFDADLRARLNAACQALGLTHHPRGTLVTIEGPRFSTRAESHMFRGWGGDVINMSVATEATLAMEAGIPYAAVAMSTDYDCWKLDEVPVTWDEILQVFTRNAQRVTRLLIETIRRLD
ncbi:MAG: S-methyl-5'-thioadenosine phosphorylase [Desulfovibrionaceae bacterium]